MLFSRAASAVSFVGGLAISILLLAAVSLVIAVMLTLHCVTTILSRAGMALVNVAEKIFPSLAKKSKSSPGITFKRM